MGIIAVLNEECMRPMGNDDAFASKLATLHAKHPDFSIPRIGGRGRFSIRHYAGPVTYTADGFLEKNKDTLPDDLGVVMMGSTQDLFAELFAASGPDGATGAAAEPDPERAAKKGGRGSKKGGSLVQQTVSTKFKTQLANLMETIGATSVQYVRCIKPNSEKSKDSFAMRMVVEQLR